MSQDTFSVLFFTRRGCPSSARLRSYIQKRDAKKVKEKIRVVTSSPAYQQLWQKYGVERTPCLVFMGTHHAIVGEKTFVWLEKELRNQGLDPKKIMTPYPT